MGISPYNLSWEEYRYYLTHELERMSGILEKMSGQVDKIERKQELAEARIKWIGSAFGFASAALVEVGKVVAGMWSKHSP